MALLGWHWSDVGPLLRLLFTRRPPEPPNRGLPMFRCTTCGEAMPNFWNVLAHADTTGHPLRAEQIPATYALMAQWNAHQSVP